MRILIVEDEPDLLSMLAHALRAAGYAIDTAADGAQALQKLAAWNYDAVVLDLMLPQVSGREVLQTLRRRSDTPVLILTARDTLADRVQELDNGADDYLVKPFEVQELLARLRAIIRRAAGQSSARLTIQDITIDTAARTIHKNGENIVLTGREYALLELLALHRGKLVTRTMIYDHLFDENDDSLSNLVEVHVSNLRKKLGKDFITTRRGQGYVIND